MHWNRFHSGDSAVDVLQCRLLDAHSTAGTMQQRVHSRHCLAQIPPCRSTLEGLSICGGRKQGWWKCQMHFHGHLVGTKWVTFNLSSLVFTAAEWYYGRGSQLEIVSRPKICWLWDCFLAQKLKADLALAIKFARVRILAKFGRDGWKHILIHSSATVPSGHQRNVSNAL